MSRLMKRSRTVDTSSATTPPTSSRTSADESPRHLQRASIIVTESPDRDSPNGGNGNGSTNMSGSNNTQSSTKKQRWSFAFRKRWFSSSSSRSSRTLSQSEDLESPTNISGMALSYPHRTMLGPPSAGLGIQQSFDGKKI